VKCNRAERDRVKYWCKWAQCEARPPAGGSACGMPAADMHRRNEAGVISAPCTGLRQERHVESRPRRSTHTDPQHACLRRHCAAASHACTAAAAAGHVALDAINL
jgi:hypothetical protein